jgi:hypothetical protein
MHGMININPISDFFRLITLQEAEATKHQMSLVTTEAVVV